MSSDGTIGVGQNFRINLNTGVSVGSNSLVTGINMDRNFDGTTKSIDEILHEISSIGTGIPTLSTPSSAADSGKFSTPFSPGVRPHHFT